MAKANPRLIKALYDTAQRLENGSQYQWGHLGACNCGNLAQTVTQLSKQEIHERALSSREGDWREMVLEYCPGSGLEFDYIIEQLLALGLGRDDLIHLERLSDKEVLKFMHDSPNKYLNHNKREDVVLYFRLFAQKLEADLFTQKLLAESNREKAQAKAFI